MKTVCVDGHCDLLVAVGQQVYGVEGPLNLPSEHHRAVWERRDAVTSQSSKYTCTNRSEPLQVARFTADNLIPRQPGNEAGSCLGMRLGAAWE